MGFEDGAEKDWGKYEGFRVHWDKDLRTFVFDSQEERDRWQIKQYGSVRNCFRTEMEREDGRPLLYHTAPQFKSPDQERRYIKAAEACPVSEYGQLRLDQYLGEVVRLAEGLEKRPEAIKSMPGRDDALAAMHGGSR